MKLSRFHVIATIIAFSAGVPLSARAPETRPLVSAVSAKYAGANEIAVSWHNPEQSDPAVTSLLVFRDKQPITTYIRLDELKPVAEVSAKTYSWRDSVHDYSSYYYTVIAVTKNGRYDILLPSINSTVTGVHIPLKKSAPSKSTSASAQEKIYPQGTLRETPLPYLDLLEEMNGRKPISSRARAAALPLFSIKKTPAPEQLSPYVFEEDYISPDGGDDYLLFETLRATFARKKYRDAVNELTKMTGTNLKESVITRGTFYLGESYYFTGDYRNAVSCFLKTADSYPDLSKKWIDSSLDAITVPENQ